MEKRIIQIETQLAFLEDAVSALQKEEEENRKNIELLKAENRAMKTKIKELMMELEEDIPARKPPHY